jgi:Na+-transporting NADH:ubiquinone oxidoreductase subunit C
MNKNSNTYTYLYATIMVVLVAVGLAFTNGLLKEKQAKNVELDKMMQILRSVKVEATAETAEDNYTTTIKTAYLLNSQGEVTEKDARTAFMVDMAKEVLKPLEERKLPVYEASIDGQLKYILPVYGAGLWGPIWGYVSLNDDKQTIFAASFSHQGETPGLGAEIDTKPFQLQFEGKSLFRESAFVSIAVLKAGQKEDSRDQVDAISGGTITSKGLEAMLQDCLSAYEPFLIKQ